MTPGEWIVAACTLIAGLPGAISFWWLFLRPSELRASTPVQITFNPPPPGRHGPQVVIATLLYVTGESGVALENLGVRVRHHQTEKIFSVWVLGPPMGGKAAGLLIDKKGLPASHFFLAGQDDKYIFESGRYEVTLLAKVAGNARVIELVTANVDLPEAMQRMMYENRRGVCFDLNMKSDGYVAVAPTLLDQ
ncbi:MAG: hypothetical protein IV086_01585 [Hyphomonadaceae bacterium]|nr:hypothetical protein [Hyphomonadaceae bacterium]